MGNFYANFALKTEDRQAVGDFLKKLKRIAYVSPADSGFIFICDEKCEQNPKEAARLAQKLSKEFGVPAFAVMNHDDDVLIFMLFDKGKNVDEYHSTPGYFGGKKKPPKGGNAEKLAAVFGKASEAGRIQEILRRPSGGEGGYVFALDRHRDLVAALGLSGRFSILGYGYIASGEFPEGVGAGDFLEIGEGPAVRFRKQTAQAAVEKKKLAGQGLLLREIEWPLKTSRYAGFPKWCLVDNPPGLLLAWGNPDPSVKGPLECHRAPWNMPADAVNPLFPASVYELKCDPTGRLLAVGHGYGNWTAEVWDRAAKELLFRVPHSRLVESLEFTPDGFFLLSLSRELVLSDVRERKVVASLTLPSPGKGLAIHPSGRYAALGCGQKLLIVDIQEKRISNELYCGGRQDNTQILEFMLSRMAKSVPPDMLNKQRERIMRNAVVGKEMPFALRFDPRGGRLFAATSGGARVYGWNDLLSAREVTPKPLLAAAVAPAGAQDLTSTFAYDIDFDREKNWLLFSGIDGTVMRLDPDEGRAETLLTAPGRPALIRMRLSSDRSILACTCKSMDARDASGSPSVQIWNYEAIVAASEKKR